MTSARSIGKATALLPAVSHDDRPAEPLPFHRLTAAQALVAAIMAMQDAPDPRTLAERAAAGALRLTQASAAAVYIEGTHREPIFAAAGQSSFAERDQGTDALRKIAAGGNPVWGPLAGKPGTVAVSFHSDPVRGALLAERPAVAFGDPEAHAFGDFARLLGVTAAAMTRRDGFAPPHRIETSIADAVSEGVLAVTDGNVRLLNRAGARLLGVDSADAVGRPVSLFWPELAQAMELGRSLDREHLPRQKNALSVSLHPLTYGPWANDAVVTFVEAAAARVAAKPLEDAESTSSFGGLIGGTPAIARIREVARIAAQSSSSVLIEGESGVGKEVLAQAIHASGNRRRQPFVAVLCAAIPRELLESELFGYEAGSFTGASRHGRAGKFEMAQGGTLLLDDIVDMPLDMQAKLLRVLQERVVTRLGGSPPRRIDVRILATSNRRVSDAVRAGLFRTDLYYRLNVLNICIPPLRERRQDIKTLAEHFLRKHASAHGSRLRTIGADALRSLEAHAWPGNVRELEHRIESEIHFARPGETSLDRLAMESTDLAPRRSPATRTLRELERELYAGALADAGGDISRAARELGISRGKLYRKLHTYELLPRPT
ncbi:MAG: sigma-54 interaction domain-containing protein [Myxococcales bacterium]